MTLSARKATIRHALRTPRTVKAGLSSVEPSIRATRSADVTLSVTDVPVMYPLSTCLGPIQRVQGRVMAAPKSRAGERSAYLREKPVGLSMRKASTWLARSSERHVVFIVGQAFESAVAISDHPFTAYGTPWRNAMVEIEPLSLDDEMRPASNRYESVFIRFATARAAGEVFSIASEEMTCKPFGVESPVFHFNHHHTLDRILDNSNSRNRTTFLSRRTSCICAERDSRNSTTRPCNIRSCFLASCNVSFHRIQHHSEGNSHHY